MNAGKDVYSEKPMCRLRDEAPGHGENRARHRADLQIGLQQRSGEIYLEPLEKFVKSGAIGKISHIDAIWHGGRARARCARSRRANQATSIGFVSSGPVRYRDWNPGMYFSFRSFLELNGGKMTDFGHHWLDVVHMYMGERAPHRRRVRRGHLFRPAGRPHRARYLQRAVRVRRLHACCSSQRLRDAYRTAITFHGDKGKLFVNRNRWDFTPAGRNAKAVTREIPGDITSDHVRNFLDCCKSRSRPNADAGVASISILPPLLAVQSYEEQRRIRFDPVRLEVLPF